MARIADLLFSLGSDASALHTLLWLHPKAPSSPGLDLARSNVEVRGMHIHLVPWFSWHWFRCISSSCQFRIEPPEGTTCVASLTFPGEEEQHNVFELLGNSGYEMTLGLLANSRTRGVD